MNYNFKNYDRKNRLKEEHCYNPDNTLVNYNTYTYDSEDNIIKVVYHSELNIASGYSILEYKRGILKKALVYDTRTLQSLVKYRFRKGLEIDRSYYTSKNKLKEKWLSFYNKDGKKTRMEIYNSNRQLVEIQKFDYNSSARETVIEFYNHNGMFDYKIVRQYDENNNLIRIYYRNNIDVIYYFAEFENNASGKVVKYTEYELKK